jgi:hypothetical protein
MNLRFFCAFFILTMVFFNCLEKPLILVFVFYSMWIPQIAYNAYCGTRHAFHHQYLVGTAVCRLFVPLYFLGCPRNFLVLLLRSDAHVTNARAACVVLVVWTFLQVGALLLQDKLGPRFFVPKQFLPQKYDYCRVWNHRHLPASSDGQHPDVETGELPECIICYNGIENAPGAYMVKNNFYVIGICITLV